MNAVSAVAIGEPVVISAPYLHWTKNRDSARRAFHGASTTAKPGLATMVESGPVVVVAPVSNV